MRDLTLNSAGMHDAKKGGYKKGGYKIDKRIPREMLFRILPKCSDAYSLLCG